MIMGVKGIPSSEPLTTPSVKKKLSSFPSLIFKGLILNKDPSRRAESSRGEPAEDKWIKDE